MVFNSSLILSVARISADAWQEMACIRYQDRLSSHQLLDLACCLPLQELGRFALWLWTWFCLPPPDSFYSYTYYSTSDDDEYDHYDNRYRDGPASSSSSCVDLDDYCYDSHSD